MKKQKQQKDIRIQQLFDSYEQGVSPQTHLVGKAQAELSARRSNGTKQRTRWTWTAVVCCALALLLITVGVAKTILPAPADVQYYTASEVVKKSVDGVFAGEKINLSGFDNSPYTLVSQKYYAYYFKSSGQLAYIVAQLGFSTENGIVEMRLIAESDGYVKLDWNSDYQKHLKNNSALSVLPDYGTDLVGEYVTNAYFRANGMHFYVYTQSNPTAGQFVQPILQILS